MQIGNSLIYFENDINTLNNFLEEFKLNKYYLVVDSQVYNLYKDLISNYFKDPIIITIPSGEEYKNINTLTYIIDELLKNNITRGDYLIAIGGGVCSDICGFAASILFRGIKHILIPTTLLAMVDATIGGKCGIDYYKRKNILGSFYEPKGIYINPYFLNTLAKEEYISGLGEVIKYVFLDDSFDLLNTDNLLEIIKKCILIKKYYVEADFKDIGLRMCLNLGHTFGHVIELKHNLLHGKAVLEGIDMIFSLESDLGINISKEKEYFYNLLDKYNISLNHYDYKDYIEEIFTDKKNFNGNLNLVFVKDFKPYLYKVSKGELYDKINRK